MERREENGREHGRKSEGVPTARTRACFTTEETMRITGAVMDLSAPESHLTAFRTETLIKDPSARPVSGSFLPRYFSAYPLSSSSPRRPAFHPPPVLPVFSLKQSVAQFSVSRRSQRIGPLSASDKRKEGEQLVIKMHENSGRPGRTSVELGRCAPRGLPSRCIISDNNERIDSYLPKTRKICK